MVKESMDLLKLLRKSGVDGDVDFLREALRVLMDAIMDAEVSARIGAEHGERSPNRLTHRNGYRSRTWDTRVGTMELRIPKLREGSYFPSLLEPRRRSEKALLAVIQQAYVEGVSTRRVDDLVKALGCEGISKSQVSRICGELDRVVDSLYVVFDLQMCQFVGWVRGARRWTAGEPSYCSGLHRRKYDTPLTALDAPNGYKGTRPASTSVEHNGIIHTEVGLW